MPNRAEAKLAALDRAAQRMDDAQRRLDAAREGFYAAVRDAVDAGVSMSEIARRRGVSRQSVQKLLNRIEQR